MADYSNAALFLDDFELIALTGRCWKSKQIAWLRTQGIAFRVNATGHPVVTRSAVDGQAAEPAPAPGWSPRVIGG